MVEPKGEAMRRIVLLLVLVLLLVVAIAGADPVCYAPEIGLGGFCCECWYSPPGTLCYCYRPSSGEGGLCELWTDGLHCPGLDYQG
jgi:hypothetical protein